MNKRSPFPIVTCIECGEEFERNDATHPGKANVCPTCTLTFKEPESVFLNDDEYEVVRRFVVADV